MIGLDFVKNIDSNWKKHIKFADGSAYYDDYCPLSGSRCKHDDCSFWNKKTDICGYIKNDLNSMMKFK